MFDKEARPWTDPLTSPSLALLTGAKAAAMLGISRAHFYRMHKAGRIPQPVRLGGSVRWRVDELRAWIAAGMPSRQRWQDMPTTSWKGGAA